MKRTSQLDVTSVQCVCMRGHHGNQLQVCPVSCDSDVSLSLAFDELKCLHNGFHSVTVLVLDTMWGPMSVGNTVVMKMMKSYARACFKSP